MSRPQKVITVYNKAFYSSKEEAEKDGATYEVTLPYETSDSTIKSLVGLSCTALVNDSDELEIIIEES